jgi:putative phage-type endonuclease
MKQLVQNTDEWKEWRNKGIGASDANIIMGASKFTSIKDLYLQKIGEKEIEANKFITEKGHRLEIKARSKYELLKGCEFEPVLAEHATIPILRASLDGFCKDPEEMIEIKYVGEADFQKVVNGEVLEQYYPQFQHQMIVVGIKQLTLVVITEKKDDEGKQIKNDFKTAEMVVNFDAEYANKLVEAELDFWNHVENRIPYEVSKNDVMVLGDENIELQQKFNEYKLKTNVIQELKTAINEETKELAALLKEREKELEAIKKYIIENQAHCKMEHVGVSFNEFEVSGSIDWEEACRKIFGDIKNSIYEKMLELRKGRVQMSDLFNLIETYNDKNIDDMVEKYRKPSRKQVKITVKKEQEKMEKETKETKKVTKKKVAKKKVTKKKVSKKKVTKKVAKKKVSNKKK